MNTHTHKKTADASQNRASLQVRPIGANKTELHIGDSVVFFSYETPVAAFVPGRGYVKTETKYSRTTSKHVTQWIDGSSTTLPQDDFDKLVAEVQGQ
jgi:hypothetical protein